jgi:serine O-acetyltransferase
MTFKELIRSVRYDLTIERSINLKFLIATYIFNPSFRLLLNYRISKYLSSSRWKVFKVLALRYKIKQLTKRNCQISTKATIGKGVKFVHPLGIVIGDGVVIKDNVIIWQQVTFGSHGKKGEQLDYPTIENNVKIFSGAKIFGGITIGENAIIGANAVVFKDVPANCTAVGIPARVIYPEKQ